MSYKKQIFKLNDLKKFLTEENSCISLMPTVRLLALPPFFLNDMKSGILYLLNSMLKKYDRSLGGIVIGYQNIKVLMDENTGIIPIGTSETEVNVSVEFYIFQPRIGSYLEGVINKKSNNHIGCLVHQYFNATILKPDDIDYEDWICKDFNVDDKIIFKVKDLDFTSLLPYIEGVIGSEITLDNNKYNLHKNSEIDSLMVNNLCKNIENEISLTENISRYEITFDEKSDNDFLESKKIKNKNEKVSTLEGNVNKNSKEVDFFTNLRKKKKKKDKEEKKLSLSDDSNFSKKNKYFNDEAVTSSAIIFEQANESQLIEKKKKKKKSGDIGKDSQEDSATVEHVKVNSNHINHNVLEKLVLVEDENSCDFLKPFKKKKEKKKKDEGEKPQILNEISQGLSSSKVEDSVFYSTLLDPFQSKEKMRISFCSPIPRVTPVGRKKREISLTKDLDSTLQINLQNELDKKEKKKKQKKRKREEKESEDFHISKKMKISGSVPFEKEAEKGEMIDDEDKLEVQTVIEQLYNQQLSKVKEAINMSDEGSCEEEKKKKKKVKKQKKKIIQNKMSDVNKSSEVQINWADSVEKKSEAPINNLETPIIGELNISEQQSFKENKDTKTKYNKGKEIFKEKMRENSSEVNEIAKDEKNKKHKKSEVQNILDELIKQEMNRVKNNLKSSETVTIREEKEIKSMVNKQETLKEESHLSLYEKLLKEAKSTIELDKDKVPVKEFRKTKNIKGSDLSDLFTSFSKKEDLSKKKKRNKEKAEICHHTPDKFRNGSMYNAPATPEKINHDKSLFSDSEQSHTSPVKKIKEANGVETKSGKSLVQNMLDEFCKEERKRLQSESDKESLISLKKLEKKKSKSEKSQNLNGKSESLYEKLLKEARSLIDSKEESPPKKKKK